MNSPVVSYGVPLLSSLTAFVAASQLGRANYSVVFLLFLIPSMVSAWFLGFNLAAAATLVNLLLLYALLGPISFGSYLLFALLSYFWAFVISRLMHSRAVRQEMLKAADWEKINNDLASARAEIKARDEFLSIASHELKNPLTAMLIQIQTALHNVKNVSLANFSVANLLKMLESAEHQTTRLSKMISDLLNVSLITTQKLDLEREEVDLIQITQQVVDNFSEKLAKDGYQLQTEYSQPVVGNWDKVRIEQVITNLVTNAIKYGEGKPIRIKVTNGDNTGKFVITDRGIGISPEMQSKLFTLFERGDQVKKNYKGLGVGLFISNQIVAAHRGRIKVKTYPGSGSTFTVELPIQ